MTKTREQEQEQVVRDEAAAEQRHRAVAKYDPPGVKGAVKAEPVVMRVPKIVLSPLAAEAPPENTPYVQQALADPETKKLFEALIDEIRRQVAAGGGGEPGTGALPATVAADLNHLRDSIALMASSLDNDAGVATTTFVATCTPPPITTV